MVKKSKELTDRIRWFKGVYEDILEEVKDRKIAEIIYRRVLFEEK